MVHECLGSLHISRLSVLRASVAVPVEIAMGARTKRPCYPLQFRLIGTALFRASTTREKELNHGLDMYLTGEKFLTSFDSKRPVEDDYEVEKRILRLGYWRKHPNLHGYIVNTFAQGEDDCEPIGLSHKDIEKLIEAVARDDLPHTEGFFFGVTDGSEKEYTLETFKAALKWLTIEEPGVWKSVYYRASW